MNDINKEKHWDGSKNKAIRLYFYQQRGLALFNELRYLILEVAKGNIESGISVKDMQSKQKGFICDDGAINTDIGDSLRMNAHFMIQLYEIKKSNKENTIKLESLEINTKYALSTMDIKNQKNKI